MMLPIFIECTQTSGHTIMVQVAHIVAYRKNQDWNGTDIYTPDGGFFTVKESPGVIKVRIKYVTEQLATIMKIINSAFETKGGVDDI